MRQRERIIPWMKEMAFRSRVVAAIWRNPVVVRDIRVRMRGSRSYWHMAAYLGLLGLLALAGYEDATSSASFDPITGAPTHMASASDIQRQLQTLYYFIFVTLAGLVCFIAPALTAASVTTERQRLTLDLLVTTPLTSSELLVGKLVSSMAFLALLLVLSLPASALCVILGGATMADLFRVYVLLLVDGLVLSAVGLYYSSTGKNSMNAIVSTYVSVGLLLWFTSPALMMGLSTGMTGGTVGNAGIAVGALNPFFAVAVRAGSFDLMGLPIPMWILTVFIAFLVIRLIVTGATYRMGSYGTDAVGSMRRQILFMTALFSFFTAYGIAYSAGTRFGGGARMAGPMGSMRIDLAALEYIIITAVAIAGLCMPNLFTPDTPEDSVPGQPIAGRYDIRRAFQPAHAGSLPYFHLWLGTLALGMLAGVIVASAFSWDIVARVALTTLYGSSLGYLGWCVARRMATLVAGVSGTRALTFGSLVVTVALPILLMVFFKQFDHPNESALAIFWVFYPIFHPDPTEASGALLASTTLCYGIGTLICPFWLKLIPAGVRYWGVAAKS